MSTETKKITATKASNIFSIAPEEIEVDVRLNGRSEAHSDADIDTLVASFERLGQLQPVVARKVGDKVQLVFGYCRHAAAIRYNEKHPDKPMKLKVEVLTKLSDREALERNLSENLRRRSLSIIDIAEAQKRLSEDPESPWKDKEIAKFFGMTTQYVGVLRKLLTLPKRWKKLLHLGALAIGPALKMTELDKESQEALYDKLKADEVAQKAEYEIKVDKKRDIEAEEKGEKPASEGKKKTKVKTSQVMSGIREASKEAKAKAAQAAGKPTVPEKEEPTRINRTRKEFVAYLESKTGPAEPPMLRKLVESLIAFYNGELSEKKMDAKLDAIFGDGKSE